MARIVYGSNNFDITYTLGEGRKVYYPDSQTYEENFETCDNLEPNRSISIINRGENVPTEASTPFWYDGASNALTILSGDFQDTGTYEMMFFFNPGTDDSTGFTYTFFFDLTIEGEPTEADVLDPEIRIDLYAYEEASIPFQVA